MKITLFDPRSEPCIFGAGVTGPSHGRSSAKSVHPSEMAGKGRLLGEFDGESGSSGEEAAFEEMQSRMSSLETMLQHARRERLNAVRHARSQLQRARVLMQRNQQEYPDKPNQEANDRTKVSLLFEGRLSKMFEDVSPLMSPGYTSPTIGSPLDSEFEVYKTPRRLSYGDELYFDEDGTSYLGNQHGSVSRNELYEYRLGNYESAGIGVPFRRHEITVHRVEIRESRSNRRKSRRDTRPKREKSAEPGDLRVQRNQSISSQNAHWMGRLPYDYDDVRRSAVSLRSSKYIQRPVLPQPRASRAEAASFPRSPAGSMTSPPRPSNSRTKSNSRAKGSSPKNKPRAQQQYDNRQISRNKEQRNEKHSQRKMDSRAIASTAGDTHDSTFYRATRMAQEKRSIAFSHSVHASLVREMVNAQQQKPMTAARNTVGTHFTPSLTGSRRTSPLPGIPHGSSSASDKSRLQSARSRPTSDESTYAPKSTSDDNSRERRSRAISRPESTAVPPNSVEALSKKRSERSVPTSRVESNTTEPSSVEDRSKTDTQWNENFTKQKSIAVQHHLADKSTADRVSRPDQSVLFLVTSQTREKSDTPQERGYTQNISQNGERPRIEALAPTNEISSTPQLRSQSPPQNQSPRMQASATTQTIMSPVQPLSQTLSASRVHPTPKAPSRAAVEPTQSQEPLPAQQNIESLEQKYEAQPPISDKSQSPITSPPPVAPSPIQPPSATSKSRSLSQVHSENRAPTVEETPREVQPQVPKQPPPRPPPPTRIPTSSISPRASTPHSSFPPSTSRSSVPPSTPPSRSATPPVSSRPSLSHPRQTKSQRPASLPHATPQPRMISPSITPHSSIPHAIRYTQSSSRSPSSSKPVIRQSVASKSSSGSKSLPPTRPHSNQPRKSTLSKTTTPPSKSLAPPKTAKDLALTTALLESLTKPPDLDLKSPPRNTGAQQSYPVSRSGAPSPSVPRSSAPSSNPRNPSGLSNKLGSAGSDLNRGPSMRVSQERRQLTKQDSPPPNSSRLIEKSSIEAKKYSISPAYRSSTESPSIHKTPTGSLLSRLSKTPITEFRREKTRTSSPVPSEKRLTLRDVRISAAEGRRMYSSLDQRPMSPSKSVGKDDKRKSIPHSPSPLTVTSPKRQSMSEKIINAVNASRSPFQSFSHSRDTVGGSPVKSEGMKSEKARQSAIPKPSVISTESAVSSPGEKHVSIQRRSSARISTLEKLQTLTSRNLPSSSETKRVPPKGSPSFDKRVPSVEMHQKTIEPIPSDGYASAGEIPTKRTEPDVQSSSDKRLTKTEAVAPVSSDKRITLTGSLQGAEGPRTSDKLISVDGTHPKTETKLEDSPMKTSLGGSQVPIRLVSSDRNVPSSEKREIPRQAPSLAELPSRRQTQTATKVPIGTSIAAPEESQKERPPIKTVPVSGPTLDQTRGKSLDTKTSGSIKAKSQQLRLDSTDGSKIIRPHTMSAPISETKINLEESKPLTSLSEPTALEKIPLKIPPKDFRESKPVTSHKEPVSLEQFQTEMMKLISSSDEYDSSAPGKPSTGAVKGTLASMDTQPSSSTNVAEKSDIIGDLPSIKRPKYRKPRKDESAMIDDAERRKPSSGPSDPDLDESSEIEDHSLQGLIEFFC